MDVQYISTKLKENSVSTFSAERLVFFREVESTQDIAKELAIMGFKDGTVILAEAQTKGRGRMNRKWLSPPGGIWFSTILRPNIEIDRLPILNFVSSLAVTKAVKRLYGLEVYCKWPNDVVVGNKKLSGSLIEAEVLHNSIIYSIIGIGVNVNNEIPDEIKESSTSILEALGKRVKIEDLLIEILLQLDKLYQEFISGFYIKILNEWKTYTNFLGKVVYIIRNGEKIRGVAVDVDAQGSLLLRLQDDSLMRIRHGKMSMRLI